MTKHLTLKKTILKRHCLSGPALFKSIALRKYLVLGVIYCSADLVLICKFHNYITGGNEHRSVMWPVLCAHTMDFVGRGSHFRNSRQDGSGGPFPGYHHSHQTVHTCCMLPFAYVFLFLKWFLSLSASESLLWTCLIFAGHRQPKLFVIFKK